MTAQLQRVYTYQLSTILQSVLSDISVLMKFSNNKVNRDVFAARADVQKQWIVTERLNMLII